MALPLVSLAMNSGQSWKQAGRVRELLPEGERLKVAVPVRWARTAVLRRVGRGRFLVFTDRRVLLFAYHRFLDVPVTDPLWSAPSESCAARIRVAERELVLGGTAAESSERGEREFKVAAVRKEDLGRYATLLRP